MIARILPAATVSLAALFLIGVSSSENITPVVIDSDGGADDACGILLFLWNEAKSASESMDTMKLVAVTTVSGNTGVHNATRNINETLKTAGRLDIPVYAGASNGLLGLRQFDEWFGQDGFGDFLPPLQHQHLVNVAVDQLVALSKKHEGSLVLICLGPLTNIALAQRKDPLFLHRVKKIHMMGGTVLGYGNIKPGVEFNVYQDPEAVDIVYRESPRIIDVMPYDPVFLNPISLTWRQNVFGKLNSTRIQYLNMAEQKALPKLPFWSSVDPQTVATYLWPTLVTKNITVRTVVETGGVHARGAFLIGHSLSGVQEKDANSNIIQEINLSQYQQMLLKAFQD